MHRHLLALALCATAACAADLPLMDFAAPDAAARVSINGTTGASFAVVGKALEVTCPGGPAAWPGVAIKAPGDAWDLSAYGRVQADLTNLGTQPLTLCLRVDNAGDWQANPWNAENITLPPGQSGTVTVTFGWSFGNRGFALNPAKVTQLLVFCTKSDKDRKFRIDALRAVGKTGDKPRGMVTTVEPAGGILLDLKTAPQCKGAVASMAADHVRLAYSPTDRTPQPSATFACPPDTLWNLAQFNQVEFTLRNPGDQELPVTCRVDNRWATDQHNSVLAKATLKAGETRTVTVPFAPAEPWDGAVKGSGSQFGSDAVAGVTISTVKPAVACALDVLGLKASVAPPPVLPAWLGTRPPVDGDWQKTFDDDFGEPKLSTQRWSWPYPDPRDVWDKNAVDVPDHCFVEDGRMKLKVTVHQGARTDPRLGQRRYDTCVVSTFDKFRQRYGYFEARMKLPTAPGLWPAFWMMPDRGKDSGLDFWRRQDTRNGGMEIDIMEYLVRFGPFRYNVAMHWDGYGKEHKSVGTERIYVQPDKDGMIVSGLLWEPGKLTFYANGQVVGRWANERVPTVPCFMQFTLPTGGWGYNPVDESKLPDTFDVDWVRVWQRSDWR